MADKPLVSVITPTWKRHRLLINRCIASVLDQSYGPIEHIIVSDGPDDVLNQLSWPHHMRYYELPEHVKENGRWGTKARLYGIEKARGDFIAYLDDDNEYHPMHLSNLVSLFHDYPDIGFAYSNVRSIDQFGKIGAYIGSDPPQYGHIDTSSIMHRPEILNTETWRDTGIMQVTIDWDLVERWMEAGIKWKFDPQDTVNYYN